MVKFNPSVQTDVRKKFGIKDDEFLIFTMGLLVEKKGFNNSKHLVFNKREAIAAKAILSFLKNNPGGVGNLDARSVNPEDLLIKFTNKDSGVVKYQIVDLSDNKLRSIDSVSALLRDPGATSNISQKSDVI